MRHSRSHPGDDHSGATQFHKSTPIDGHHEGTLDPELFSQAQIPSGLPHVPLGVGTGSLAANVIAPVSPPNSTSNDTHTSSLSVGGNGTYPTQLPPSTSMFPLKASDAWRNQPSPSPALWGYRPDRAWETLLTGNDFDLDAVNMSLLYAAADYVPVIDAVPGLDATRSISQPAPNTEHDHAEERAMTVQKKWHTFSEKASSGQMTPNLPQEGFIDEPYRKRLAERLQQRVQPGILPSTPFLVSFFVKRNMKLILIGQKDLCIQAYFSKFHRLFPVVHIPTFRPGAQNSVLLLSICSAGSLFIGSPRALTHGISMFERLNKAILASVRYLDLILRVPAD